MNRSDRLVGNRLALVGTVLYFLEWVAIPFLPEVADGSLFGAEPEVVVAAHRGHSGVIAFAAGWFGVVLLGRVLFAVALRKSFRIRDSLLVDFAVGAMISVRLIALRAGPSMTRYSLNAWQAIMDASCTMSRVLVSRFPGRSTSSNAKLSKYSISSGSLTFRVETWPGNNSS